MIKQLMIKRVMPGGATSRGDAGTLRIRDDKNVEWQIFVPADSIFNLLVALQGAGISAANQRKAQPDPKLLEALKIRELRLTGLHTQTGEVRAVLSLDLGEGLQLDQRVSVENLRRLVTAGQELLEAFDSGAPTLVQ